MNPAAVLVLAVAVALLTVATIAVVDRHRRHHTDHGLSILDDRPIDTWRDDLDHARPDGCECTWPPSTPDQSTIRGSRCTIHPPITRETNHQ